MLLLLGEHFSLGLSAPLRVPVWYDTDMTDACCGTSHSRDWLWLAMVVAVVVEEVQDPEQHGMLLLV